MSSTWTPHYNKMGPPKHTKRRQIHPQLSILEHQHHQIAVADYQDDIVQYMGEVERTSVVSVEMIDLQPEVKWYMRPYLLDFLLEIHQTFRLDPQTLFLAVNIVDKYCSKRVVFKRHYQLVGCTALWLAAKYEDKKSRVPTLKELVIMCRNAYDAETFVQMERHILSTLEWSISHTSLEDCLQLSLFSLKYPNDTIKTEEMTRFFCEISMYNRTLLHVPHSIIAITAHLLASATCGDAITANTLQSIIFSHVDFDDDATFDEDLENQFPEVTSPFLSGFSEDTMEIISKTAILLLLSFQECSQSLRNKYTNIASEVSEFVNSIGSITIQFPTLEHFTLLDTIISDRTHYDVLARVLRLPMPYNTDDYPQDENEQTEQHFHQQNITHEFTQPHIPQTSPLTTPPSASSMSVFSEGEYAMACDTPATSPVERSSHTKRKRNWVNEESPLEMRERGVLQL